ncbi:amidohydrolase [Trebonia kvetii]|uniref:Amidohydrolase n=1 Tax=Trebonia kvetii TaxID=2480626 RepID=A0A6P2BTE4_9ACTN|nr:amidohydrolase family protein [Trebonia kvetii]TVZ02168.1 amidohydrolase [Trebonia kvetii]
MPLQPSMKLISVDDHLIEHPRVWADRLPQKYLEAGPRIVDEPSRTGRPPIQVWHYAGKRFPQIGLNAVVGKRPEDFGVDPVRYADMIPGCYDPKARLTDMDLDGVHAAANFPSFPRFAGALFTVQSTDFDLALRCVRAYNDFVIDEWCATAPGRFIPLIILPLWDVDQCVAEIHRCAGKGAKGITFPENTVPLGLPSVYTDHWEKVFSAAEETDMPLCMHFGSSGQPPATAPEAPYIVTISLYATNSMSATTHLLFSPVFHRHPKLKVALSEGGVGWIPYLLERIDRAWERHRWYQNVVKDVRPSDLFRKHFYGCFIDDVAGLKWRHDIGIGNITWECDYPHSDSYWPHSRKYAEEVFADVPDDEVRQIVELNARDLFNFHA